MSVYDASQVDEAYLLAEKVMEQLLNVKQCNILTGLSWERQ